MELKQYSTPIINHYSHKEAIMKLFDALNNVGRVLETGTKGTFTLNVVTEEKKALVFTIDADKTTLALTGEESEDAACAALVDGLVKGYEVVALTWEAGNQ